MKNLYVDESLILRQMDFKENDKIITFLTKNNGKKSGIIKGAKKIRSSWVSKTEPFSHATLNYREKEGIELVQIIHCDSLENFIFLRKNYEKFIYASYFLDLISLCIIPDNESKLFFDLLLRILHSLSEKSEYFPQKIFFEFQLLKILGLALSFESCIICGKRIWAYERSNLIPRLKQNKNHQLDCAGGGIRCPECTQKADGINYFSPGTLIFYKSLELKNFENKIIRPTSKNIEELDTGFIDYFRYYVGKTPKSHSLLPIKKTLY